ncbi:hypothetical protein NUU61_009823 [Penicillium alfredii]|uniref:F-box domain-containing protein n=1 Tax=Penicillium alfredii TaxID=1506179 RepID=A0A9W9EGW7_9EURO|nr:uncharacterized protein NUU61_009823 [Penicillium alfredii]KAJ5081559.1 hypothetical protein NUU61_009823 [Penicillium alfredii]
MLLVEFPSEILLAISEYLEYECDLNALFQASRRLYAAVNPLRPWNGPPSKASVRRLLEAGVPPGTTRHQLWMPIVVTARRGHAEIVQQFLDHGVDPNPTSGFYKDWEKEWWEEGF